MTSSIVGLILIFVASLAEAKFSRGDSFQNSNIDGTLTIVCKNKNKNVTCRDVFMEPWPYDIFLGLKNSFATAIEFRSTNNGNTQTAVTKYFGSVGRSDEVNLGVLTLFQKPLLRIGENKVQYSILDRNGKVIEADVFSVNVSRGKNRTCETRQVVTDNPDDCDHSYSLCQEYFKNQNFCR